MTVLAEEPTQASIRELLHGLLAEVLGAGEPPSANALGEWAQAPPFAQGEPGPLPLEGAQAPSPAQRAPGPSEHADTTLPSVAYLLPGLPPEGSGGSHSLVQEARGLRELGAGARVCIPASSLPVVETVYGNDDALFVAYPDHSSAHGSSHTNGSSHASVLEVVGDANVVVATEYPSVDLLARLSSQSPEVLCAYYVQDYEPLFAAAESSRSDRALLSYRALDDLLLFAKTDWLRGVVGALHGVRAAKVAPSLDSDLFHARGRRESAGALRVTAMIRPRTPRRRPTATLHALRAIADALEGDVELFTFGCDEDAFAQLDGPSVPCVQHLGLLSRAAVGELMRGCDIFIDASAYQAFGRTGLEAMACGAVPMLPELGGVHEYAVRGENALIVGDADAGELAARVVDLAAGDRARLGRLRDAGLLTAQRFSVERAARSQLELFTAALKAKSGAERVA